MSAWRGGRLATWLAACVAAGSLMVACGDDESLTASRMSPAEAQQVTRAMLEAYASGEDLRVQDMLSPRLTGFAGILTAARRQPGLYPALTYDFVTEDFAADEESCRLRLAWTAIWQPATGAAMTRNGHAEMEYRRDGVGWRLYRLAGDSLFALQPI